MAHFLTLDVGTTSLKTCLFDQEMNMKACRVKEYMLSVPAKNIIEMEAEKYWELVKESTREVIGESGVDADDIISITCTTQGETLIPIDKAGNVLTPAIVWLDARAKDEAMFLSEHISDAEFYAKTGIPEIGPANPICKLKWYKDKKRGVYDNTYKFLLLEDYLIYKMTGKVISNIGLIGTSGYLDITENKLWDKVFDIAGLDKGKIPKITKSGEKVSALTPVTADELGLSSNTVVTTGAIDQVCTAIGAGNIRQGIISEVTGTCLVLAATTDNFEVNENTSIQYLKHFDDRFLILPYCPTAGVILKWFKDVFCSEEIKKLGISGADAYDILTEKANEIPPGADGLIALPHFEGRLSPKVNSLATGGFVGVTLQTKKAHFVRAILESVAYMLRENVEFISRMGTEITDIRSVGGGSKSDIWNQIKADVCKMKIHTMQQKEAASLGAAILGAVACGYYASVEEACEQAVRVEKSYSPNLNNMDVYDQCYEEYLSIS